MDFETTRILEQGMYAQQQSIPETERCDHCDGRGQVSVGCAITHSMYAKCFECFGTGRKADRQEGDE